MKYPQDIASWQEYLLNQHPKEIDLGLERVMDAYKNLNCDFNSAKMITIAGTNGKGTSAAFLTELLLNAGYKVGTYTSPHILKFNERIKINGIDIDDKSLQTALEIVDAKKSQALTFFEHTTLAALVLFAQNILDFIILEVGLGGRLDATNIIDADVGLITSIALDHCDYLGNTLDEIAFEKAGIFKKSVKGVIGEPDFPASLLKKLEDKFTIKQVNRDFNYVINSNGFIYNGKNEFKLPTPAVPIANVATCLAACEFLDLDLSEGLIITTLQQLKVKGRMEQILNAPQIILDVAHNPHAAKYLASNLLKLKPRRIVAVCGMLKDKDVKNTILNLSSVIDLWLFVDLDCDRSEKAINLSKNISHTPTHNFATMSELMQKLVTFVNKQDVIIVLGSFYTVAEFKKLFVEEYFV